MTRVALVSLLLCVFAFTVYSQPRDAGQAIVPKGWENEDSVRFGVYDIADKTQFSPTKPQADSLADELQANVEHSFGAFPLWEQFVGKRKLFNGYGIRLASRVPLVYDTLGWCDFSKLGYTFKQRIYYPTRSRLAFMFDSGYYWRYVDTAGYSWHHERYDSNDVSPYAEFLANPSIVGQNLITKRFTGTDSTVKYGNEGRVILGSSDNNLAANLLKTYQFYQFPVSGKPHDTAKQFTARLEFHIDTNFINQAFNFGKPKEDLPLVRLQAAFKPAGQSVLPFVPFKTVQDSSRIGWFIIADTVVTLKNYRTLHDSWRADDTLENGSPTRTWKFKQLHVPLSNMPESMKNLIVPAAIVEGSPQLKGEYGHGSLNSGISGFQHPDSLISIDNSNNNHLLEMRVLSTYRATVRIRSLSYQDTISDKFFYRRMFGDTAVHSCNPDGSYGGYDDSVKKYVDLLADSLQGKQRGILINDTPPEFSPLSASACGYLDYMLSKRGIYLHVREQEINLENNSDWSLHFRRERMSHNGEPPSLYENQTTVFYSSRYKNGHHWLGAGAKDVFPHDYLYYGWQVDTTVSWPSSQDSMYGVVIGRVQPGADPLEAYDRYTHLYGGMGEVTSNYRKTGYTALRHPSNKRMAVEVSPQGWGLFYHYNDPEHTDYDPHYNQRPTTPEETQSQFYIGLANGATSFNHAQTYDTGGENDGAPGAFGVAERTDPNTPFHFVNNYNIGRRYSRHGQDKWGLDLSTSMLDEGITPYYLGYSNTFRSIKRTLSRINAIYPRFKQFEWLDAYSAHRGIPLSTEKTDSVQYAKSFLKCMQTRSVSRWSRNPDESYIDSLAVDAAENTFVEVGLFRDQPNNSLKGFAALVVNTRLWPSLRDAEDSVYYNEGLDPLKDRSRSTLGDIDVRKVYFRVDTSQFPNEFRGPYYVIRDLWHPDTTYLVHCDSNLALYFKPGDAKLLYLEKGIAIDASPTAAVSPESDFGYNNGRRMAMIMNETRSIVTYTRNGKLYVSDPSIGSLREGYHQRSQTDNISTGIEICLDSAGVCSFPSISAGMNDTAVGIVYHTSEDGGRIKAAYRSHPDSAWSFAIYATKQFTDFTILPTPVITPYANVQTTFPTPIDQRDSIWWVAVPYNFDGINPSGIVALKLKVSATSAQFLVDFPLQYFYKEGAPLQASRSQFPTIASRPLRKESYPVRLAWQKDGKIYYNRFKDESGVITAAGKEEIISTGLPSPCQNVHPSIALAAEKYSDPLGDTAAFPIIVYPQVPGYDPNYKLHDYVTWEAKIKGKKWDSKGKYWPVVRQRTQHLDIDNKKGPWGTFRIFKPKYDTTGYHWPNITASSRDRMTVGSFPTAVQMKSYHDVMRIGWHDEDVNQLEFVNYLHPVRRTILKEDGQFPSLPQSTYDVRQMTDSMMVPKGITFAGTMEDDSTNPVRVTNGWFPQIGAHDWQLIHPRFMVNLRDTVNCYTIGKKWDVEYGRATIKSTGGPTEINWLPIFPDFAAYSEDWPVSPYRDVEARSATFSIAPLDSIIVPRRMDTIDVAEFRTGLVDSSDFVMTKLTLRKAVDSSWAGTIDSAIITLGSSYYPGNGQDSLFAYYKHPIGGLTDSVFIELEILRGNDSSLYDRGYMEFFSDDSISTYSFKIASDRLQPISMTPSLRVDIYPNPLTLTATVRIATQIEGPANVALYSIDGEMIKVLFEGMVNHSIDLTLNGEEIPSGIYMLHVQSGNTLVVKKVVLIK